jgi:hypothetical protein
MEPARKTCPVKRKREKMTRKEVKPLQPAVLAETHMLVSLIRPKVNFKASNSGLHSASVFVPLSPLALHERKLEEIPTPPSLLLLI